MLNIAFSEYPTIKTRIYEWNTRFEGGYEDVEDDMDIVVY